MEQKPGPEANLAWLNARGVGSLSEHLGIRLIEARVDCVRAEMPITRCVTQPMGVLHGGATVALAETVASIGGCLNVNLDTHVAVGLEINANHLRAKWDGTVVAVATPVHVGSRTHVWDIRVSDEAGQAVAIARCTLAVIPRPNTPSPSASTSRLD